MASSDPSSPRNNRRRRRPAWSTVALAALAPAAARAAHPSSLRKHARRHAPHIAKGKGRGDAAHAMVDAAHRPVVPMGSSQNNNLSGRNEKILADAAVAAEGAAVLYGAAQNNNAGSGSSNRGNMVVVQPENLRGSEAQQTVDQQSQSRARGDVQLHAWPHPDTFQADEQRQPKAGTEYYYKNGQVVLEVQGAPAQTSSSDAATNGKRVDTAYHVAAYNYGQAQPPAEVQGGASKALPSPQEDWDAVAGKQVLLRPRLPNEVNEADAPAKGEALPPMGSATGGTGTGGGGEGEEPAVYYYDPQALQSAAASASSANAKTGDAEAAPELTLPEVVYDANGRAVKLEEVHAGGRNEVFLEVRPRAVWGADGLASAAAAGAVQSNLGFASTSNSAGSSTAGRAGGRGQDQWIVLATVATMSLLVGALSARRLRNRRLLEGCLHPELDDECDDDAGGGSASGRATPRYDKKFDADGASGASGEGAGFGALLGGRRGGGYYGTSGDGLGSGLHWRGDAEKFDV